MSEYYGVSTPTETFLTHWGVKGMKWGVRKRPADSNAIYSMAYKKAEKKLANIEKAGKALGSAAYKEKVKRVVVISPNKLKRQALSASVNLELARKRRDKSLLGRHGFGKTARDYTAARVKAKEATSAYYDSLSKKEFEKLRRRHVG